MQKSPQEELEMTNYRVHTLESAPEGSKVALEQLQSEVGFLPNLAAAMAESPSLLGAFTAMRGAYALSKLPPLEREIVLLVAAVAYGNAYGVAVHSTVAKGMGASAEVLDALRAGLGGPDSRIAAIAAVTRTAVLGKALSDNEVEVLSLVGLSNGQLLDLLCGVAIGKLVALTYLVAPGVPLDEPFRAQAWSPLSPAK
jgi:alkylhydroperoxidase family enzyme